MIALKIMDAAINWIYNKVKYEYNKFKYFHNIGNYLNSILSKFKIFISYISSNIIESNYVYYLSIEECFFNTSNIEDIKTLYIDNINVIHFYHLEMEIVHLMYKHVRLYKMKPFIKHLMNIFI